MIIIAHRGANREAQENSWSAFEKAIEGGATRIELDVQLTADGHAAVIHDDDIAAMTGKALTVSALTRNDLRAIHLLNGEPIPFLDEVIERLLARIELNIEIKGANEVLAQVVGKVVNAHQLRDKVIVSSFHAPPLVWLRRHAPDIKRACLWGSDTFSWPYFAPWAPPVFLDMAGTSILHPEAKLVDEHLMDQANARGWTVYAWVPMAGEEKDRDGLWSMLKTLGLHGLCTNYPRQLKSWLLEAATDERHYGQTRSH